MKVSPFFSKTFAHGLSTSLLAYFMQVEVSVPVVNSGCLLIALQG